MVAPTSTINRRFSFTAGVQPAVPESKSVPALSVYVDVEEDVPWISNETQAKAQASAVQAPPRETKSQPGDAPPQPWAMMEGQAFMLAHRDLLARMAADPYWSDAPAKQPQPMPAAALGAVEVFGFYNALTRPSRPVEPESADGDHVLRSAVIQERQRLHEGPHLKATEALQANLRRAEHTLAEREAAWAHQNDAHTVRRRIEVIAASDQPMHVKTTGLMSLATAKPAAVFDARIFLIVHRTLINTLAADPEWRKGADASARCTAPEPGTIFRFYESLRRHMHTQLSANNLADSAALRSTLVLQTIEMGMLGLMGSGALSAQLRSLDKALGAGVKTAIQRF